MLWGVIDIQAGVGACVPVAACFWDQRKQEVLAAASILRSRQGAGAVVGARVCRGADAVVAARVWGASVGRECVRARVQWWGVDAVVGARVWQDFRVSAIWY